MVKCIFLLPLSEAALTLTVFEGISLGGAVAGLIFDIHSTLTFRPAQDGAASLSLPKGCEGRTPAPRLPGPTGNAAASGPTPSRGGRPAGGAGGRRAFALRGIYSLIVLIFVFVFLLAACAPTVTPIPEPQIISTYATPAAQPWLSDAFACAPPGTVIRVADQPEKADLSLRLGEPDLLVNPAYQIGFEEILVVTHRQSVVQNMPVEDIRKLFAGQGDPLVQVWVYAQGEEVQGVFEQAVMQGRSVTSFARLAVSPQHMSDVLNREPNAVGILPRRWKAGDPRIVYSIPDVPVLAVVRDEPKGAVREVIACLQEQKK